jgi:hypothetical protein
MKLHVAMNLPTSAQNNSQMLLSTICGFQLVNCTLTATVLIAAALDLGFRQLLLCSGQSLIRKLTSARQVEADVDHTQRDPS